MMDSARRTTTGKFFTFRNHSSLFPRVFPRCGTMIDEAKSAPNTFAMHMMDTLP